MFSAYQEEGAPLLTDPSSKIRAKFLLENTTTTIANTLRRCILSETRSVSFRADLTNPSNPGIVIRKNTSMIFNEMLAHRITLVPLGVRNLDDFDPSRYECVLRVRNENKGPITEESIVHVKTSDFQVREKDTAGHFQDLTSVATKALFPSDPITNDSILLTLLRPQWNPEQPPEEIDLTAYPVIGRGREFMGFCPVSQCSFANTLDPDPVRQEEFFKQWLQDNKKQNAVDISPDVLELHRQEWSNMAIQRCFLVNEKGEPYSFTFTVESVGVRPVYDIVLEGIRAVSALVAPYTDSTRPMSEIGMSIQPANSRMNGVDVFFEGQEHTLGNLFEELIVQQYLSEETETIDGPITYASYKIPHPLQRRMFIRIGIREGSGKDSVTIAREVIANAAQRAQSIFDDLARNWESIGRPRTGTGAATSTLDG